MCIIMTSPLRSTHATWLLFPPPLHTCDLATLPPPHTHTQYTHTYIRPSYFSLRLIKKKKEAAMGSRLVLPDKETWRVETRHLTSGHVHANCMV